MGRRGRAASFCHDVTSKQKKFIKDEEVAAESAKALQDDTSHVTWVMFGYVPGTVLSVERVSQGAGGLEELVHTLDTPAGQGWVRFAFVKVMVGDSTYGFAPKVVMITWCGAKSKLSEKARSSMDRMLVKEWMNLYCTVSAEYPATSPDELKCTDSHVFAVAVCVVGGG